MEIAVQLGIVSGSIFGIKTCRAVDQRSVIANHTVIMSCTNIYRGNTVFPLLNIFYYSSLNFRQECVVVTTKRGRKRGRRSVMGMWEGGDSIRQKKVFLPFQQILDHVQMMKATWGFGYLMPVTKQGVGERGRGQMIFPLAQEDTASGQPHRAKCYLAAKAGGGIEVLIAIRPSSHCLPPLAEVQLSLRELILSN